jgi:dTMP kinase
MMDAETARMRVQSTAQHPLAQTTAFIAIEGIDGAGKSTTRDILGRLLVKAGVPCIIIGPNSWLNPQAGRQIVGFREQRGNLDPQRLSEARFIDKRLMTERTLKPILKSMSVIADRYIFSDAVYHDVLLGIPAEGTLSHHLHSGSVLPDIVIYVEVEAEIAAARIGKKATPKQFYENLDQLRLLLAGFRRVMAYADEQRICRIIHFANHEDHLEQRVARTLVPAITELIAAKSVQPLNAR